MQKLWIVTSTSVTLYLSGSSIEEVSLLANSVLGNSNSLVNIELTTTEVPTKGVIKIIW